MQSPPAGIELLEPLTDDPTAPHRAQSSASGRIVVVRSAPWHEEARVDALGREAEHLRTLRLPGLVGLLDVVEDDAGRSLVLEHAAGGDLGRHVARHGPLPRGAALDLAAALADALAELHAHGLGHGAVGPDHVLLDAELRPVLCDLRHTRSLDPEITARDLHGLGDVLATALGPVPEARTAAGPTPGPGHDRAWALADALRDGTLRELDVAREQLARAGGDGPSPRVPWAAARAAGAMLLDEAGTDASPRPPLGVPDDQRARLLAAGVALVTLAVPVVALLG